MKKITILFCACYILASTINTQAQVKCDTCWKRSLFSSLNFSQTSFTNWSAGGDNNIALLAITNAFYNYKASDGHQTWDNSLDMAYGIVKNGALPFRKNDDRIELISKYGHKAFYKVYYTGLLNFRSQFAPGYNFPNDSVVVSRFLAPAWLQISVGLDWKPNDYFSFYLSPAAGRVTLVMDQTLADQGAYGVDAAVYQNVLDSAGNTIGIVKVQNGKTFRPEFGAMSSLKFQKDVVKNVNVKTRLDLFNNYTDKNKPNRKNIDVTWETAITMKINKYISSSILSTLLYDNDIPFIDREGVKYGPRVQFKQLFGIGFSMKLK
jgi:hypothetical protein